ncbi:MAG: DUF3078 domain-containing protein [Bacteroidia bacterium]|nr:DUF3078 domain-containing protein [Bacteroidia bacterium]
MKNSVVAMLIIVLSAGFGFAQDTTTMNKKTKELADAKTELAAAQAKVDALVAQIEALKPVIKWKTGGFQALNFNQGSFSNWSLGGVNAISVTALGNAYANYKFSNWTWDNNLDLAYGLLQNKGEDIRKNEDKIDFQSKVGRKASDKLSWASIARFESQFDKGYDFNDEDENRPVISRFMAPAYLKLSLGIDYKPTDKLSIYISPAAGKWTFVTDDSIAAQHLYIPEEHGNANRRGEFGALTSFIYQNKKIAKNIGLRTSLELFNNYTDDNRPNRRNIDVDWQVRTDIKISKYIGANLFTHLKYDHDTKIEYDPENKPGVTGPRTQFKELFGLGFNYKF